MKKKIIFVTGHLQFSDGVAKVLLELCNNLDKNIFDITVAPVYRCDSEFSKLFDSAVKIKPVFGTYFPGMSKLVGLIPPRCLYKKAVREDYDLEVAFQYGTSTTIIASSTNQKAVHVAWMHGYDEGLTQSAEYAKFDRIVNVSRCNADRFNREFEGEVSSTYCYNLVDDERIAAQALEPVEMEGFEKNVTECGVPIFVSVGRHSTEKGYKRLVEIFGRLKAEGYSFKCWLIGDGPEHAELVELVKSLGLEDCVKLVGAQTNPHKFTAKSDVFICSSFSEGYSTACTEAAILGVPVITTCVPGGEEIIETCECGRITEMSDESLETAIREVLDHPELIEEWKNKLSVTSDRFRLAARKQAAEELIERIAVGK